MKTGAFVLVALFGLALLLGHDFDGEEASRQHDQGYFDARMESIDLQLDAFDKGYDLGRAHGYKEGLADCESPVQGSYYQGYDAGYYDASQGYPFAP